MGERPIDSDNAIVTEHDPFFRVSSEHQIPKKAGEGNSSNSNADKGEISQQSPSSHYQDSSNGQSSLDTLQSNRTDSTDSSRSSSLSEEDQPFSQEKGVSMYQNPEVSSNSEQTEDSSSVKISDSEIAGLFTSNLHCASNRTNFATKGRSKAKQ